MKVLIDNGHGSDTPGKRSPDGKWHTATGWSANFIAFIESGIPVSAVKGKSVSVSSPCSGRASSPTLSIVTRSKTSQRF